MRNHLRLAAVIGCLALSAFCLYKAFPRLLAPDGAIAVDASAPCQGNSASPPSLVTTPIQDLRVGMRVVGRNPTLDDDGRDTPQPDPPTWRLLRMRMEHKPGCFADAELLRPLAWLEAVGATEGKRIWLDLPEMHAAGFAEVLSVSACPPIEAGTHPVVTGTFRHEADSLVEVHLDGDNAPITCTPDHPLWSATRRTWVPASDLRPGEQLLSADGTSCRITSIVPRAGPQTVYGLEVLGENVYHVGSAGVLAHNASFEAPKGVGRFPAEPDDFTRMLGVQPKKVTTTQHGTRRYLWEPNSNTRIRFESHPGDSGPFAPRHHGEHYHVELKPDGVSWNQAKKKGLISKIKPDDYLPGHGTGFLPDELFPGSN